ncbi:MAG: diacylglycerol kinase family lipid kinase [Bacteroidales bacterium]|jgi:diacylglycerol kinase (ATP)|nr:diacylglycerol kinase family lipid kinase [Bacteroidales bacterium]
MWQIIINPKSGKKVLQRQLNYLFKVLDKKGIEYSSIYTQYAGHAAEIARDLIETGTDKILVVGGDGSFSEVVNGIFSAQNEQGVDTSKIKIAILPHGTGNDWARFWGLTRNHKDAVEVFLKGFTRPIDIGQVTYHCGRKERKHYFVNSIGFGLDQKVVHEVNRLKYYFGSHSILYFLALVSAVFTYKSRKIKISIDNKTFDGKVFTMNIGNGCYSGGGMKQNPSAVPYDGAFDAMFACPPSFRDIITALPLAFNGKLTQHRIIHTLHTNEIHVEADGYFPFEADGIQVNAFGTLDVKVLPLSLQMVVPEG